MTICFIILLIKQLYQSLRKKPEKKQKESKYIHAVDVMDMQTKDRDSHTSRYRNCGGGMLTPFDARSQNLDKALCRTGNNSRQFFMMYATENEDGTTTSVAFGSVSNTNIAQQSRKPGQPRNIVTNSNQSMFAGSQR